MRGGWPGAPSTSRQRKTVTEASPTPLPPKIAVRCEIDDIESMDGATLSAAVTEAMKEAHGKSVTMMTEKLQGLYGMIGQSMGQPQS